MKRFRPTQAMCDIVSDVEAFINSWDNSPEQLREFVETKFIKIGSTGKHLLKTFRSDEFTSKMLPNFHSIVINHLGFTTGRLSGDLYLLLNNHKSIPTCQVCGKEIVDLSYNISPFCSYACMRTGEGYKIRQSIKEKAVEEKYGVSNVMHIPEYKQRQHESIGETDWNERNIKSQQTCIERYGVENPMQHSPIYNKMQDTCVARYGVNNYAKTDEYRNKFWHDSLKHNNKEWLEEVLNLYSLKEIAKQCDVSVDTIYSRINHFNIAYTKGNRSSVEQELVEYIKSLYSGQILLNYRIAKNVEVDVLLPDLKLGFEFNGIYWHSFPFLDFETAKYKHQNKSKIAYDNGIHLIHIDEVSWLYNKAATQTLIANAILNKTMHQNIKFNDPRMFVYCPNKYGRMLVRIDDVVHCDERYMLYFDDGSQNLL